MLSDAGRTGEVLVALSGYLPDTSDIGCVGY